MPNPEPNLLDDVWQKLLDKDDRTSPAEYPDMALITREEVASIIVAAARPAHATEGLREALMAADAALVDLFDFLINKPGGETAWQRKAAPTRNQIAAALAPSKIAPSEPL